MGVAGPPAAALLLAAVGYRAGLGVCAAVFAVSALATLWAGAVSHPTLVRDETVSAAAAAANATAAESLVETQEADDEEGALAREALMGLGIIWRRPWLRYVQMLAVAQVLFAVGPWMVALPVAITNADVEGVQDYSLVLSAFAGGAIVGALLGGRIKVAKPGLTALPCLAVFGVASLATGLAVDTLLQIVVYALAGAGTQVFDVLKLRGIRRTIPENEHGRAYSADFFFSFAALPLGQSIGAAVLAFVSPEAVLVFGGLFVLATGLLPLLSREVRDFGTRDEQAGVTPADGAEATERSREHT